MLLIKYFYKNLNLFLILSIIFLIPLFFIPEHLVNSFTLPKIVLFRSSVLILLFSYVFKVFLDKKFNLVNNKLIIFLFTLFLFISLSSLSSDYKNFSIWGAYNRQMGLYSYLSFFLFFFLLVSIIKSKPQIEKIIYTIIGSSFLVSAYALIQYFGFDPFSWSEIPSVTGRAFSSLGQPNFLGHFLAINIPLTIYALVFLAKKIFYRFFLLFLLFFQFYALIFSLSRAAWLAFLGGLTVGIFIFLIIKRRKRLIIFLFSLFLVLFLFTFNYSSHYSGHYNGYYNVGTRISNLLNFNQGSGRMRINYWQASLEELSQADSKTKLFGFGADSLSNVFVKHYGKEWGIHETINSYPDRSHNLILDILLQFGLLGLLSFSFFVGFIFFNIFKYFKNNEKNSEYWLIFTLTISLIIYFFNNLFSFSSVSGFVYFYLYLALICVIIFKHSRREIEINLSTVSKYLILLFLFIFSLSFIFFKNINLVHADYYYTKSLGAGFSSRDKCLKTFDFIDKGLRYNPDSLFYRKEYIRYNLNCYHYFKDEEESDWIRDNLLDIIENTKEQEDNYGYRLYEARIYSLLSQKDDVYYARAENIYKELIEKSPYIITSYKELARLKMQKGEVGKAITYLKKAIEISPLTSNKYLNKEHREELENELNSINSILNNLEYQQNNKN